MTIRFLTIFLGAFLLFQVQPMLGKQLIPLFGGSPAVWTTCMLFFQIVLIGGYAYAHGLTFLNRRMQAFIHLSLLGISLFFVNLDLAAGVSAGVGLDPVPTIFRLLTISIGFPFLLLSASTPLLQYWFTRREGAQSPWKLYALSNTGSLLALLSYPLLFEPNTDIGTQFRMWKWGYSLYLVCCGICIIMLLVRGEDSPTAATDDGAQQGEAGRGRRMPLRDILEWLVSAACGSSIMLAVTNQICQQVAVVPFIWVLTLALYLVTFIVCFGVRRASGQGLGVIFLAVAFSSAIVALTAGNGFSLQVQLLLFTAVLVSSCMICHVQMVRMRPAAAASTWYYLVIALGGAGGAVFESLLAPELFTSYVELPFLVSAVIALFMVGAWRARKQEGASRWPVWLGGTLLVVQIVFSLFYVKVLNNGVVESTRNFYGTLKVIEENDHLGHKLTLKHGVIAHGSQYLDGPLRQAPTTYYGPYSGAGLAFRLHPRRREAAGTGRGRRLRVGLVGLGVGTLASYGETGDLFRFFEIDPTEIHLARDHFTYLSDSRASVEIVTGDARQSLLREARQGRAEKYDVLVIDAFSNDTIPVHLITREAVELYLSLLQEDGILLFHISSRSMDLMPVVATHAGALGMKVVNIYSPDEPAAGCFESNWAIMTNNRSLLENEQIRNSARRYSSRRIDWTDRFAGIWQVLN
jgi:hypothetical protein